MMSHRSWQALSFALVTSLSSSAMAEEDQCYLHRELSVERQLRRLSLDLRGVVPDVAEYAAVEGLDEIPEAIVKTYLESDEFRIQMRRHHENLLWTNPNVALANVGFALGSTRFADTTLVYHVTAAGTSRLYRGGDGTHYCQNRPQSELGYQPDGLPVAESMGVDGTGEFFAEGWVEIHPYWEADPSKTIKVCAFDAQATTEYTLPPGDVDAGTHTCDSPVSTKSKSCGCGPDLAYCMLTSVVQPQVLASMREQLLRLVDDYTDGTRPYSGLISTKRSWVNGPLAHYFHYLGRRQTFSLTQNIHQPADGLLPEVPYTAVDQWVEVEREAPHAGILTLPAFLLRFQTNRARANRYRIAFEGQHFQPAGTKDTGCAKEGDDLTQRCVCRSCHVTLEPLSAHFGLFVESGSTVLSDFETEFPTASACANGYAPRSAAWCARYYSPVPDAVDPDIRPYRLKALEYDDAAHPLIGPNFSAGPEGLAQKNIESGLFHEVATRNLFELLMKRSPDLDPTSTQGESKLIQQLAEEFRAHDNFKLLVARLIQLPAYRRMP
ncbi:hypothetical protein [Chondromyces crocatus]|uniref:DUF1585 domain-containing protein n=1 Tax=Chondromyces crocatus TaxID=52 RepID=A0A0K1E9A5_CHOCO|nr:hypothetical protein [Chondromyces crocatus]AKT37434.1 uncharacterized protein CMC5_015750 [Chondromyces crocatus]